MTLVSFQEMLRKHCKMRVDLQLTQNRSIMLNVLERKPWYVRLSMHKMFLDAPESVVKAIAGYVKGRRDDKLVLRTYIQENIERAKRCKRVCPSKLVQKGDVYHLDVLYDLINEKYFEKKLDLDITWYGQRTHRSRSRVTFGLYQESARLVKIHRMMDAPFFPSYFVEFVVYHEMVHAVVPGQRDERGRFCVHNKEFKARERLFEHYERAVAWEKQNKERIFYGRP